MKVRFICILTVLSMFMSMSTLPAFAADASGYAGELQWSLENGNLTISDVGKMEDYAPGTAPWYAHKDDITSITISYGVESIGDYAFYGIDALEGISIPDSVKYMGVGIFDGCSSFNLSAGEGSCAASYAEEYIDKYDIRICESPEPDIPKPEEEPGFGDTEDYQIRALGNFNGVSWDMMFLTLRIKGTGSLANITSEEDVPWRAFADRIETVYISSGITDIGSVLFSGIDNFSINAPNGSDAQKYAVSNNIPYNMTYEIEYDFGSQMPQNEKSYIYTDNVLPNDWSRVLYSANCAASKLARNNGMKLLGWSETPGSEEIFVGVGPTFNCTKDMRLYAVYSVPAIAKYHFDEELTSVSCTNKYSFDSAPVYVTEDIMSRSGFSAEGWRYDASAAPPEIAAGEEIPLTENETDLYAVYSRDIALKYADGDRMTETSQKQYFNGSGELGVCEFTVADAAERDGYEFYGWAKGSPDGERLMPGSTISITEDTVLYPVWEEIHTVDSPYIDVEDIYGGKRISISCASQDAQIYYSLDGSDPSDIYSVPIEITTPETVTIKAKAQAEGYNESAVAEKTVTVEEAAAPISSAASGAYEGFVETELSCLTPGAQIYYTLDGSDPLYGTKYSNKLILNENTRLLAAARAYGYADSVVSEYNYTVSAKSFKMLRDNYSFPNSRRSFGYQNNYVIPLEIYVEVLGNSLGTARYNNSRNSGGWKGSCFGFSATSLMFFEELMDYNDYYSSAEKLYDIPAPGDPNAELTGLIESYQVSQFAGSLSAERINNHFGYYNNNPNCLTEIIEAVENFQKTGEDPIVIDVWGNKDGHGNVINEDVVKYGHAVVPYACEKNEDGSHTIYVYDNNYPGPRNHIKTITIDIREKSFAYQTDSRTYDTLISYQKLDTIYNTYNTYDVQADSGVNTIVTISADSAELKNIDGVPIEFVSGAYEVLPVQEDIDTDIKQYILPEGDYVVTGTDDELKVSVTNKGVYTTVTAAESGASVYIDVNENDTGYVYLNSMNGGTIETMNSSGVKSYMETSGANLGVSSGTENVDIMADSAISFNGSIQSVGAADAIGTASIELNTAGDTETPFSVVVPKNTLSVYDGALEGELALNIYNNSGALRAASVITCLYDSNGNFVSVLKQTDTVLGHGENYTNIGGFNVNNVKEGSSIKCFVWDSLQSLEPLSEAISITVLNN